MSEARKYDPGLRQYANPTQAKYLDAVLEHGGERPAARALGIGRTTIQAALQRLELTAARRGYAPEYDLQHPVAPGQMLKGASTLYKDGVPVMQWVKTRADADQLEEIMREAAAAMAEEVPRAKPVKPPRLTNAKLANLYTLTDSHVGMLAWHKENLDANGDWDLTIAERTLAGCFEHMVTASPAAEVGIVAQLGDWMHSDGLEAKTPTSGHILDQDGRFPKVVAAAIRILRRVVDFSLRKHRRVVVLLAEGNHDLASSVWLRAMFKALYEKEPRVEVIDSELPYYAYQHGKTMLAWHHGHLKKNDQLPLLFAAQFPKMWGDTTKRYAHTGHRHHVEEKEHPGMQVVQHSTLASRDAYAARGGWMSERQCTAITYHSEYGQVCRNTVTPEMLEAA
jgi:hypothetical protein